jgi:hypothetical protein
MPLLANVLITTARSVYNSATKQTGKPVPYLQNVPASISPFRATAYTGMPANAPNLLEAAYLLHVDAGTDIAARDRITSITLPDGVTRWPGDIPASSTNEYWEVIFVLEEAPDILPERGVYIRRVTGGGLTHL